MRLLYILLILFPAGCTRPEEDNGSARGFNLAEVQKKYGDQPVSMTLCYYALKTPVSQVPTIAGDSVPETDRQCGKGWKQVGPRGIEGVTDTELHWYYLAAFLFLKGGDGKTTGQSSVNPGSECAYQPTLLKSGKNSPLTLKVCDVRDPNGSAVTQTAAGATGQSKDGAAPGCTEEIMKNKRAVYWATPDTTQSGKRLIDCQWNVCDCWLTSDNDSLSPQDLVEIESYKNNYGKVQGPQQAADEQIQQQPMQQKQNEPRIPTPADCPNVTQEYQYLCPSDAVAPEDQIPM